MMGMMFKKLNKDLKCVALYFCEIKYSPFFLNREIRENKGRIIFYEEGGGGLKILWGGAHFFPNLKRMGHIFFSEFNIKYLFKKGMQYQKSECKLYY